MTKLFYFNGHYGFHRRRNKYKLLNITAKGKQEIYPRYINLKR